MAPVLKKVDNSCRDCDLLPARMAETVRTRVSQRIRRLLEDRQFTNRALATHLGHKDQWVSNLLAGRFALSLDELDRVAAFLSVPPSDIVRRSDDAWELSPSEMRVVRALRMLPPPVRDHLVTLADYLIGVTPDEVGLLRTIRDLDPEDQQTLERWAEALRRARVRELGAIGLADLLREAAPPASPERRNRRVLRRAARK